MVKKQMVFLTAVALSLTEELGNMMSATSRFRRISNMEGTRWLQRTQLFLYGFSLNSNNAVKFVLFECIYDKTNLIDVTKKMYWIWNDVATCTLIWNVSSVKNRHHRTLHDVAKWNFKHILGIDSMLVKLHENVKYCAVQQCIRHAQHFNSYCQPLCF